MKDPKVLYQKALEVRQQAYAPYSRFLVGSCIETAAGNLYTGCNVENASYSLTICAEMNALGAMVVGEKNPKILQVAVVIEGPGACAPCGACRQGIFEFATQDTIIHLFDTKGDYQRYSMQELLPHAFGPANLK